MRVVRSATLPVKEELYIAAARVSGLSRPYIVTRHVLPRVAGPVIVQTSLLAAAALLVQTGLGVPGPGRSGSGAELGWHGRRRRGDDRAAALADLAAWDGDRADHSRARTARRRRA